MSWNSTENVVKKDGQCWNRGMQKWCFFWVAKQTREVKKKTIGYRCSLFDLDKVGYASLPECNKKYGKTYDGKVTRK